MKFNRGTINYLFYPLLLLGMFYLIYRINDIYILDDYEPKELTIGVEFKVEEEDIFQLFYRDSVIKLNERMSQKILIEGSPNFQWVKFSIPDTLKLSQIRFDFGNKHKSSPVEIRKFVLRYNGNIKDLAQDSLMTYFRANHYVAQESNMVFERKVIGKRSDPFLLSEDLSSIINQLRKEENYSRIALNIILSLFLSIAVVVAVKQKSKSEIIGVQSHQIFVCLFLILTILPFLDNVFFIDKTEIQEKRELVSKPVFEYENVNDYPVAFENYFNDHFGFRNKLISYGGISKAKLFNTSPSEEKVIMGKNDWLFYWKPDIRSSYKNENPFTNNGLAKFTDMISSTNEWATLNDKLFLTTIYPNKHSVYEENIPLRIRNLKKDTIDRTDMAFKMFKEKGILHVKHLENFLNHKKENQLYFKNDTHWNAYGSYLAYRSIIDKLRSIDNEILPPLKLNDFSVQIDNDFGYGDLLNFMGVDNTGKLFTENAPLLSPKQKHNIIRKSNYFGKGTVYIENGTVKSDKVVLLVGDSFSNELIKLLPFNFKKTYFLRSIWLNNKIIEEIQPNIIIYGIVERNLENFN